MPVCFVTIMFINYYTTRVYQFNVTVYTWSVFTACYYSTGTIMVKSSAPSSLERNQLETVLMLHLLNERMKSAYQTLKFIYKRGSDRNVSNWFRSNEYGAQFFSISTPNWLFQFFSEMNFQNIYFLLNWKIYWKCLNYAFAIWISHLVMNFTSKLCKSRLIRVVVMKYVNVSLWNCIFLTLY